MTELTTLVDRIEKQTGFIVYAVGGGRPDLNDWLPDKKYNYVRALYNLKTPETQADSLVIGVRKAIGGAAGNKTDFNVVAYGLLPAQKIISEKVPSETRKKVGLLGRLGLTEKIGETTNEKKVYEGSQKLSEVIEKDDESDAYFVSMTIRADISDDYKRISPNFPALTIVGNYDIINDIVRYLENNPKDYMKFVKSVLPDNKFPKVNKGIIAESLSAKSLVFLEADKIDKSRKTNIGVTLMNWVYEAYGREIHIQK